MRILIVEDETRIADFLQRGLRAEGHFCVVANDGETGLSLALEGDFDLILLDMMLPGIHGRDICQQLRMNKINTPLIILSAMDSLDDVIAGLRMGADDYMTKPFSFEELLARIETVMRRSTEIGSDEESLAVGRLAFDRESLRFSVDGKEVKMTAKELAIIELLMSNPGTLFSRERILSNVWGLNMDPLTNVVDVYIGKLRKKIDVKGEESMIETVRGLGYRLNVGA
ncbi:MAG: response regulator transcription factor [Gammaproteobacteria bacterium]|nr:response regulator transcription factor [Gammaproteobacteria bacterium]NNL00014.1 response regulator transcription factor [Xanthomonadales bacterium]